MIPFFSAITGSLSKYDVLIVTISGQSNARGNTLGTAPSSQYLGLAPDTKIYNYQTNLFEDINYNVNGSIDGLLFGVDIPLAHVKNNIPLIMNKRAVGDTSLWEDWQPGGGNSNDLIEGIQAVKQKIIDDGYKNPYWVFYWNQGESDIFEGRTTNQYVDDWNTFFNNVESNQQYNKIFTSKTNQAYKNATVTQINVIRAAKDIIANADSRYEIIDMNDYTLGSDEIHFTGDVHEDIALSRLWNGVKTELGIN